MHRHNNTPAMPSQSTLMRPRAWAQLHTERGTHTQSYSLSLSHDHILQRGAGRRECGPTGWSCRAQWPRTCVRATSLCAQARPRTSDPASLSCGRPSTDTHTYSQHAHSHRDLYFDASVCTLVSLPPLSMCLCLCDYDYTSACAPLSLSLSVPVGARTRDWTAAYCARVSARSSCTSIDSAPSFFRPRIMPIGMASSPYA
jgi:hypothetical protein